MKNIYDNFCHYIVSSIYGLHQLLSFDSEIICLLMKWGELGNCLISETSDLIVLIAEMCAVALICVLYFLMRSLYGKVNILDTKHFLPYTKNAAKQIPERQSQPPK